MIPDRVLEPMPEPEIERIYPQALGRGACRPWLELYTQAEDVQWRRYHLKPNSRNPTVRHYRGACGNVSHGEG